MGNGLPVLRLRPPTICHSDALLVGVEGSGGGQASAAAKREIQNLKAENEKLKNLLRLGEFKQNVLLELVRREFWIPACVLIELQLAVSRLDWDELEQEYNKLQPQLSVQ